MQAEALASLAIDAGTGSKAGNNGGVLQVRSTIDEFLPIQLCGFIGSQNRPIDSSTPGSLTVAYRLPEVPSFAQGPVIFVKRADSVQLNLKTSESLQLEVAAS